MMGQVFPGHELAYIQRETENGRNRGFEHQKPNKHRGKVNTVAEWINFS